MILGLRAISQTFDLIRAFDFVQRYESYVQKATNDLIDFFDGDTPEFALVLGSGLGPVADEIKNPRVLPYSAIRGFGIPQADGHDGQLVHGTLNGVSVVGLKGRLHYYDVADEPMNSGILRVVLPVHALAQAGVANYFATNASGGLNTQYKVGDMMAIKSHINMIPNPLLGRHHNFEIMHGERAGERVDRFVPMNGAYDKDLLQILQQAGSIHPDHFHTGVYAAVDGTTYETEAESIAFRRMGVDAVGMSTTIEGIVARSQGMKLVGLSSISNAIDEDGTNATSHIEVIKALNDPVVQQRRADVITEFFRLYGMSR